MVRQKLGLVNFYYLVSKLRVGSNSHSIFSISIVHPPNLPTFLSKGRWFYLSLNFRPWWFHIKSKRRLNFVDIWTCLLNNWILLRRCWDNCLRGISAQDYRARGCGGHLGNCWMIYFYLPSSISKKKIMEFFQSSLFLIEVNYAFIIVNWIVNRMKSRTREGRAII